MAMTFLVEKARGLSDNNLIHLKPYQLSFSYSREDVYGLFNFDSILLVLPF